MELGFRFLSDAFLRVFPRHGEFCQWRSGCECSGHHGLVSPAVLASGPAFQAQLYVGPAGSTSASQLSTNGVSGTPATFQTGAGAGYFFGGARTIEGYAPGTTVTLQVRVWNNSGGATSFETAAPTLRGGSNLIQVGLGGGVIPTPNMVGLQGVIMPVPEPSSALLTDRKSVV